MKNNKHDLLIIAATTSNLFYSIAYPIVHTVTVKSISSNMMSLASLLNCVFIALVAKIWLDNSEKLYKYFGYMLVIEAIAYILITVLFLTKVASPAAYFMADAICSSLITRNIICAATRLKAFRYKEKERETYDNKMTFYSNITSVIGFTFSALITLPISIAFICMAIGVCIDNVFYYIVFRQEGELIGK